MQRQPHWGMMFHSYVQQKKIHSLQQQRTVELEHIKCKVSEEITLRQWPGWHEVDQ